MEPFRLDRQAKVFLVVLVVVALAMVPLAPFMALVFGGLSLVVLCLVFLLALLRNRRAFGPLTRTEGVLALSATVFALGGALVITYATLMLGAGNAMMLGHAMLPFLPADGPRAGDRSVWYSDADKQARLKQALAQAGIPFKVETREGKEYVKWSDQHDAAAEAIAQRLRDGPFPKGSQTRFQDAAMQKAFAEWLTEKGVKHETVREQGEDWLHWDGGHSLVHEFMTSRRVPPCPKQQKAC
jgi:hypothetical protein